ncbi:helix-turn-helix domain-containing protein [Thermovenabulum gondwanense]|uniref:HTH-type transcriptional regulator Xre n=1 Tax=Thermovenabulum gondwanense TaxID=520767 RepID=A0A162MTJ5_9FIRM|nr:helix-turn-helix domain-containing protein [Thermovenabulum gondwanense]KYO67299.1 HTH-type transcriptional regulator Xre [Thermovenabulum gondwanense]
MEGSLIRQLRKNRKLSLKELAEKTGLSVSYLSEIETGKKKPSLEVVQKLADALNVSVEAFFNTGEDSTPEKPLSIGEKIHLLRQRKNLSLEKLAELAGISASYLCQIEKGNVLPSLSTLTGLTKFLDIKPEELLNNSANMGAKLKKLRTERGLTQVELAKKAGVSPALIGQLENGKVEPSIKTLEKLAQALSVTPCFFVTDDDGAENIFKIMNPALKELFLDPKVKSVLEMVADCTPEELSFILRFIELYKSHRKI